MKKLTLASIAIAFLGASTALAEDLSGDEMTNIIRSLAPTAGAPVVMNQPSQRVVVKNTIIIIDPTHSLDFEVYFPFDSAEITPQAQAELVVLGRALESKELSEHGYLIAGHTDAKGSDAYNLDLSARRASAVVRFLVENFAIDPERLVAVGFGETLLKSPDSPYAAINRRVEVALILSRE
jgi:outer membrane protein OmpA-like peptidoglycan-associated protein